MTTQADTAGTQPDRAGEHVPTAQDAHELVRAVVQGARLTHDQASVVFAALGAGDLSEAQTAALLAGLHARGEEAQEVAGAATAFRAAARAFPAVTFPLVDVVGTGGDGAGTINISTGAGLVAASMGISVAKHGNRAVSSRTGAADVIAELGLPLEVDPEVAVELLARDHFAFLFAQAYHPAMRYVAPVRAAPSASMFYRVMARLSPTPIPEDTGDFRLLSPRALAALRQLRERHRFMKGLFGWVGFNSAEIRYQREARVAGRSKFNFWRLWNFALEGITSFSTIPLRVATYLGLMTAVLAMGYGLFVVAKALLYGDPVAGWPTMMAVILFLGGVQLTALGTIGEYLGRMYLEVKQRPLYLVADWQVAAEPAYAGALSPAKEPLCAR